MKREFYKGILGAALLVAACAGVQAQTNVYSLGIYSAGTSYWPLCSFTFPFPPYHYKLTELIQYEDTNGLVIIDAGHEKERGGVLCRYLDVEYGSESYSVPLDRVPPNRALELMAESAERDRREKAWLESGFFRVKTYILGNRTDSSSDQEALFALREREKFKDGGWTQAMGPESNIIRITASTNDLVIWDRVIREFDEPPLAPDFSRYPPTDALKTFVFIQTNVAWQLEHSNFLAITALYGGDRTGLQYWISTSGRDFNVRTVYSWAHQASQTKQLSDSDMVSLHSAIGELPAGSVTPPIERLVIVSFAKGTNWITRSYDSQELPAAMHKIYAIIGERYESQTLRQK